MRLSWLGIAVWIVFSSPAITQEIYSNPTLGFSIAKPADWHYATAEQHRENLSRTDFADPEFKKLLTQYARTPFIAMMRYKEPYDDLNPSVRVNARELGTLKGAPPEKIVELIATGIQRQFQDFKIEEGPTARSVGGHPAGYVRIAYTIEAAGRSFPTLSELWAVPRGDLVFLIGAGIRQDGKTGSRADVQSIIDTIKID